ncbi:hypothetical protein A3K93_11555 [Acinetobacter sp. NCu2D-2]|uniref:DUF6587 family protein n=1 Tax=Acinetobacter sp. NCu2D-2 TaxID=1608473 RepID=UPI0007CDDEED|nr:DUF6587 family protein [Acinetobacter sp. NCu2D-2]ANF82759.1 hypothetical protein A3K93_11555 [Acinetobacter sp. NCu2D-2]
MIEILIVAALVLWSAVVVFKKVFPKTANSMLQKLSRYCAGRGWNKLAARLKPNMVSGCGGSCGCSSNEAQPKEKAPVQVVKWK